MKKKLFYFLATSFLVLTSCSNNDDSKEGMTAKAILPKTVIYKIGGNETPETDTFIYDGNKIVSITGKFQKTIFVYGDNQIVEKVKYHIK